MFMLSRSLTLLWRPLVTYLDELAEAIRAEIDPSLIPRGDTTRLFRMYAILVRAKRTSVEGSDVHDAWVAWALDAKPNHSAIQPFEALDRATQAKDEPYVQALRRVASRIGNFTPGI
jgi:hypothetical protein